MERAEVRSKIDDQNVVLWAVYRGYEADGSAENAPSEAPLDFSLLSSIKRFEDGRWVCGVTNSTNPLVLSTRPVDGNCSEHILV